MNGLTKSDKTLTKVIMTFRQAEEKHQTINHLREISSQTNVRKLKEKVKSK
jgi:hypothetical protein